MDSRREFTLRLEQYKTILRRDPCHLQALEKCLGKGEGLSDYDKLFLHIYAPILTSYAEWVLKEAAALGISRLYFLARDGWLLQSVVEVLAKKAGYCLEMKYLKVSRYCLRLAEYGLLGDECLDLICVGGIDISFRKIMKRAALTKQEAFHVAELAGFKEKYHTPLTYKQILDLKDILRHNRLFLEYVDSHSKACRSNVLGYLRQEGLMEDADYALADCGWVGTTQRSLQRLISCGLGREKKMEGLYFGLYELPKGADKKRYHSYYIHPGKDIARKVRFSVCLFETLFSSPGGMTMGYRKEGERYLPIESKDRNPNGEVMRRNKKLADWYASACQGLGKSADKHVESLFWVERLLKLGMGTPTRIEAQILGNLLFCDDVLELQMQKVAAGWDREEIKKQRFLNKLLIKAGRKKEIIHESGWPEGSITNAGGEVAANLRQERMYKYFMYLRKVFEK